MKSADTSARDRDPTPVVSFRPGNGVLRQALERRGGSIHTVARRDLRRYYALLVEDRAALRGMFTPAELCLLYDQEVMRPVEEDVAIDVRELWLRGAGAVGYDGRTLPHGGSTTDLLTRLHALTPGQALALWDALEIAAHQERGSVAQRLWRVGLLVEPVASAEARLPPVSAARKPQYRRIP